MTRDTADEVAEDVSPPDDPYLSGEDRFQGDSEARDATHALSAEEQEALFTQMRRYVEAGESDRDAWAKAYRDVTENRIPTTREGEEGALRRKRPVEARKETPYEPPGTRAARSEE